MTAAAQRYRVLGAERPYPWLAALAGAAVLAAAGAATGAYLMTAGHHVTGLTTTVAWGLPHVFAITLILAGAGAFALAALAPGLAADGEAWGRLGTLASLGLLLGGLAVLGLDLASPHRLLPPGELNLLSSFSRNILLYTGFTAVALLYLATFLDPRLRRWNRAAGALGALIAVLLALNVGSIFGLLPARPAYGGAIMLPLFAAAAAALGTAALALTWLAVTHARGGAPSDAGLRGLGRALLIAVGANAALLAIHFLALLYLPGQQDHARFLLTDGGVYPATFWLGAVAIGIIAPALLLLRGSGRPDGQALAPASGLVIIGGLAQSFVMIVGAQAQPLAVLPGAEVVSAGFGEEAISYRPSGWELLLGIGGVGTALLVVLVGLRALPLAPADGN